MLQFVAKALAASQFPGFSKWAFGGQDNGEHQHSHEDLHAVGKSKQPYRPTYFSEPEYQTIEILAELIIPADETPGAKEAGVSEFIDFMAAHGEREIQQPLREGLARLDAAAQSEHAMPFGRLSHEQQTAMLEQLAASSKKAEDRTFFLLIRRYTVMGYYTSRVGLQELDYPGLRLYTKSPACPHTEDPEHLHLRSARV